MFREPKLIAPVLEFRLTPEPPDPFELVLPKLNAALELLMLSPTPLEFEMLVVGEVREPATFAKVMPVVALSVVERLLKFASSVPAFRFSACPVPFKVTSETVKVPNMAPVISATAFPPVNPLNRLSEARVIAVVALVILTTTPLPLFMAGNRSLPAGGVRPVILERLTVASWPMNFWPFNNATGPA